MHVSADASAAGYASTTVEASSVFSDNITNNSGLTAGFQIGFHVDGALQDNSGGTSFLTMQVWQNYGGYSIYEYGTHPLQTWQLRLNGATPTASSSVNQDYLTETFWLTPGSSFTYVISMDALAYATQFLPSAANPAQSSTDASNTLTITSFSAFDQSSNPLPPSDFGSSDGIQYSQIDAGFSETPEPGTGLFVALGTPLLAMVWRRRRAFGALQMRAGRQRGYNLD